MTAVTDLTSHQLENGVGIIRAVKARGWPKLAAVIATETALDESGMRILASANVPESQRYSHDLLGWTFDGLGHDHASMGMFQQQTGTAWTPAGYGRSMNQTTINTPNGWGPPVVLMDPERSTDLFLSALAQTDWQGIAPWIAAQGVQHSAFPDGSNYRAQHDRATAIVDALWPSVTTQESDMVVVQDSATGRRYLLIPGKRAYYVGKVGAQEYAGLFGLQIKRVSHQALVDWDNRMALGPHGVK